jgi:hypothetical protein
MRSRAALPWLRCAVECLSSRSCCDVPTTLYEQHVAFEWAEEATIQLAGRDASFPDYVAQQGEVVRFQIDRHYDRGTWRMLRMCIARKYTPGFGSATLVLHLRADSPTADASRSCDG